MYFFFFYIKGRGHDYWQDEKIQEEMPSCRQMFNIFHPFDPVAYRYAIFTGLKNNKKYVNVYKVRKYLIFFMQNRTPCM